jgi:uncharacterized membrane protein
LVSRLPFLFLFFFLLSSFAIASFVAESQLSCAFFFRELEETFCKPRIGPVSIIVVFFLEERNESSAAEASCAPS